MVASECVIAGGYGISRCWEGHAMHAMKASMVAIERGRVAKLLVMVLVA